jgi:hypothetical protein
VEEQLRSQLGRAVEGPGAFERKVLADARGRHADLRLLLRDLKPRLAFDDSDPVQRAAIAYTTGREKDDPRVVPRSSRQLTVPRRFVSIT